MNEDLKTMSRFDLIVERDRVRNLIAGGMAKPMALVELNEKIAEIETLLETVKF